MKIVLWIVELFIVLFVLAPAALAVYVLLSLVFALDSFFKLLKTIYENRLRDYKASN